MCRIYPAAINPFVRLNPDGKACPLEAWASDRPLLQREGRVVDAVVRRDIRLSRDTDARTTAVKRRVCSALQVQYAALADEGFMMYSPQRTVLLAALDRAQNERQAAPEAAWRFVSNRAQTLESLTARGAVGAVAATAVPPFHAYLGLSPPSA